MKMFDLQRFFVRRFSRDLNICSNWQKFKLQELEFDRGDCNLQFIPKL